MRGDLIIVGETRGAEALDTLQAMNTGHGGSMSTCHVNTPPRRGRTYQESMVLMAGIQLPMRAIRQQLSRALDLIVQIERFNDGARRITSITEVQRMEGDTVTLQDIFEYRLDTDHVGQARLHTGACGRPLPSKFERNGVRLPAYSGSAQLRRRAPGRRATGTAGRKGDPGRLRHPTGRVERRNGR